ncbi:helix-turn-helix domain-containing protein [Streptomyces sp. NPDC059994]|uniref:helix-turn-helix domain-containing protein n=1 Tax=Streptomyces sp. NPDC059994 TaxID=3347029 RepID=UPI0036B43019
MATAESEDFAALLRELKDRSGRSYGVLAGKLHVSTSTLHRYCNGDAVPNEYAPVDRLARLCGATREESVELHRRWILADEARRRARAGNGTATTSGSGSGSSEVPPAAAPAPVAEARTDTVPAAATEPAAEAAPEPDPAPEPGPAPGSAHEPEVVAVRADPGAPRRTGRMSRRTRLGLIAAGVVVALGVPAVAVATLNGGAGDGKGAKSETVADDKASGDTAPKATPPKSPSPDASSPSPSGSASASGTPSSEPPSPSRTPVTGTPVSVGVSSYQWDGPCGKFYLLDQKPEAVPPSTPLDSRTWARTLGAVDGGHLMLQLTATGKSQESVVINALHVRVVERRAPLDWNAYSMGSGCGGAIVPQSFDIDLDKSQPLAKPVAGQQGDAKVPAGDFPYKVSTTDPQVLNLDVHTDAHDVTWYLEVEWSSGDRSGKLKVYDTGGKPFHSSAIKGRPAYEYRTDTDVWERLIT